jgi:uncharacterized protein YqgC (DUF456 family)
MLEILMWCLTGVLMLAGVVGVIVPLLPGTTLIILAAVIHKLVLPMSVSWLCIGVMAVIWVLSIVADFAGVVLGTKLFGGSKWGMAGASGGALVGVFFSLPALLIGTILGAVVAEKLLGNKTHGQALKAGAGAATGFAMSAVARLCCAAAMIGLFIVSAVRVGAS